MKYLVGGPLGPVLRVDHEQHVRESCPKISPVSVVVSAENKKYFLRKIENNFYLDDFGV